MRADWPLAVVQILVFNVGMIAAQPPPAMRRDHPLFEIQGLFRRQVSRNVVDHFFAQFLPNSPVHRIADGRRVQEVSFLVSPTDESRAFTGTELSLAITKLYDEHYLLVALWIRLFADCQRRRIATEIVRAFVKRCIQVSAEDIAANAKREVIDPRAIHEMKPCPSSSFYARAFDWERIEPLMRQRFRQRARSLYHGEPRMRLGEGVEPGELSDLFRDFAAENGYDELVRLIESMPRDDANAIESMIGFGRRLWRTSQNSRQIRRALEDLLRRN